MKSLIKKYSSTFSKDIPKIDEIGISYERLNNLINNTYKIIILILGVLIGFFCSVIIYKDLFNLL